MKKKILMILLLLVAAAVTPCRALDLILRNGDTLYNVTHVTPLLTRVHLISHPPHGNGHWGILIRTVRYCDLMPESLQDLQNDLIQRGKSLPPELLRQLTQNAPGNTAKNLIHFVSLRALSSGTIGWAQLQENPSGRTVQLGRIFIRHAIIPRGSTWLGDAVPENGTFHYREGSYPVYIPVGGIGDSAGIP